MYRTLYCHARSDLTLVFCIAFAFDLYLYLSQNRERDNLFKMKTSSLILALVSLASANLLAARDSSITTSPSATTTSYSLSPVATCLAACSAGDVQCEAACVGSAHPNSLQVNQTDDCVAKCPQGDGSESASEQYSTCVQGCISSYYPSTQTVAGASVATVTSVSATTTGTATGKATGELILFTSSFHE